MTKRREVDRILTRYTGRTGADLNAVKRELSKAGVVLRTFIGRDIQGTAEYKVEPIEEK